MNLIRNYYRYSNDTYEARNGQRSIFGPVPREDILKQIAHIQLDHNWKTNVENQLQRKNFRCRQILTMRVSNNVGVTTTTNFFSFLKTIFTTITSHPYIATAIGAAIFAPGYIIKYWPTLGLSLKFPTLMKINNTIKKELETKFHSVAELAVMRSLLPEFIALQKHEQGLCHLSQKCLSQTQTDFDLHLFKLIIFGVRVAQLGVVNSSREDPISCDPLYLLGPFNHDTISIVSQYNNVNKDLRATFFRALLEYFKKNKIEGDYLKKITAWIGNELLFDVNEMLLLLVLLQTLPNDLLNTLKENNFSHYNNLNEIFKNSLSVISDFSKTETKHLEMEIVDNICEYFTISTLKNTGELISNDLKKTVFVPTFISLLGKLPIDLYKEFIPLAKFSFVEWQLIGSNLYQYGKGIFHQRKWIPMAATFGIATVTCIIAYKTFQHVISPTLSNFFTNTKYKKLNAAIINPINEINKNLLNFNCIITEENDFEKWHDKKLGFMRNYRTITEGFQDDLVLRKRRCTIFDTPIRIPVLLQFPNGTHLTDPTGNPYLFEEIHLQALLMQQMSPSPLTQNLPIWWQIPANVQWRDCRCEIDDNASDEIELRLLLLESHNQIRTRSQMSYWEKITDFYHRTVNSITNRVLMNGLY